MKNIKRLWALFLAIIMVLTTVITGCAVGETSLFDDVPDNAWYTEAVKYCQENGLMRSTSAVSFEPNGVMTRAMLAAVLYRRAGEPAVAGTDNFTDTMDDVWYSDAILWATQNGIISGYGNGLFGTDDPVTREQLVAILWRLAGSPSVNHSVTFTDQGSISAYAVAAVAWAKENNVINGKSRNHFDPHGNATRAEVAVVLMNRAAAAESSPAPTKAHILVAYFSATNNTESIANHIKTTLGDSADLYEIVPETPYSSADLNYTDNSSRANREQNDPGARPAIDGTVDNMAQYDVIFLGYPIWHGQAPKIMYTFVESYDLSGKTIIPFCTSGSSGIGSSATNLAAASTGAEWRPGNRFSGSASQDTVTDWVNGLDINRSENPNG